MFFSRKIAGLARKGDFLYLRAEYGFSKFHRNELASVRLLNVEGQHVHSESLPVKSCMILFTMKNGRRRTCFARRLTPRRYAWLLEQLGVAERPRISLP